jgi:hypothetical protein
MSERRRNWLWRLARALANATSQLIRLVFLVLQSWVAFQIKEIFSENQYTQGLPPCFSNCGHIVATFHASPPSKVTTGSGGGVAADWELKRGR